MGNETVVVGNGVSGWACAKRLADAGERVTLVGPGIPHDRPPLSKRALASGRIPFVTSAAGMAELAIDHVDGQVRGVDLDAHRLEVATAGGRAVALEARRLVWATGFAFPLPPVPGLAEAGAHQNHAADGTLRLHERATGAPMRVCVIGAGLIGVETAATLAVMGHQVTLLDMLPRPLARLPERATMEAEATLAKLGVRFFGDCPVDEVSSDGDVTLVRTRSAELVCDEVVVAAGFGSSLPPALAPPCTATIDVNETLAVPGYEDVWACGDIVRFPHPRWGPIAIPHWDHALHSGRHVADAILGSSEPYVRDPYWFSDIGPLRLQLVGHSAAVADWADEDGLHVGRDECGEVAAVLLVNLPARLVEARNLVAGAALNVTMEG